MNRGPLVHDSLSRRSAEYLPLATAGIIERRGENLWKGWHPERSSSLSARSSDASIALSDDDIRVRMNDLDEGRMRTPSHA